MNEEHLAKVNSLKVKGKDSDIQMARIGVLLAPNSNYHRKWREQARFRSWRQISNSNRMRNICRNGARSEADLAQLRRSASSPFLFFVAVGANFFQRLLVQVAVNFCRRGFESHF